jgi:hypothetical protein
MEASGKLHALLALPRGIQPIQMEAGRASELDCALEQKPRFSLKNIETQFLDSPAIGLVVTLISWPRIYLLVFQIGEEWKQVSELVFTFTMQCFSSDTRKEANRLWSRNWS